MKSNSRRAQLSAHVAMLLFTVLISTSFPLGAMITQALDPVVTALLRFLIAAALVGMVVFRGRHRSIKLPAWQDWLRYGAIGILPVIYFVTMFEALRLTNPVNTSAVFTLVPAMTALIAFALLGQRTSRWSVFCLIVGALGAIWILFDGSLTQVLGFRLGAGEKVFFVGCAFYSAYSPMIKRLHRDETIGELTFWSLIAGSLCLLAYGGSLLFQTTWVDVPAKVYVGVLYLGMFCTALTFWLIKFASVRLPAAKVMAYTYLIPGLVMLWQMMLGQSPPSASVLAGLFVVSSATFMMQRDRPAR